MSYRTTDAWEAIVIASGLSPSSLKVEDFAARLHAATLENPWSIEAMNALGNRLFQEGAYGHAAICYGFAARDKRAHGAIVNLGRCEIRLGQAEEAKSRARMLVEERPDRVVGWQLLGEALVVQGHLSEAVVVFERATVLSKGDATLARQWAALALSAKDTESAVRAFDLAWQWDPSDFKSLQSLVFYKRCLCHWEDIGRFSSQLLRALDAEQASLPPFDLLAEPATAAQQLACARQRAARIKQIADEAPLEQSSASNVPSERLRVGFVSHGFGHHPSSILTHALFEQLHESRLELHLFSTRDDGNVTSRRRLAAAAHAFYELPGLSQRDVAIRVREAGVEILVDLDGYSRTREPEVFAYRPAPIQVSWLAYPGTTGADYMDYVIADQFVLPPELQQHFVEKTVYLPRCYQCSDTTRIMDEPAPREACGLPPTGVVYACFNTSFKLNPRSVRRMLHVLAAVPGSVLWLLQGEGAMSERLCKEAQLMSVEPSRLVFMKKMQHRDYLARYRHVDLFLDTEDYNAHTVASDALWAGCPVLTRPGDTFASRVAGSLNHHLGMPEMNVVDDAAFVAKAVRYGRDAQYRAALKVKLRRRRLESDLFDIRGFARDLESLFLRMAAHGRAGGLPGTFAST
jgi:predicted O-linked N-acetylglucosamine transferase (SPINDLY family)